MSPAPKRILYVEDSKAMRSLVSGWLTAGGYDVTLGEDGEDGLDKANSGRFDLVVSDVNMPKRDGFELCRAIKQGADTAHVPVVLLTRMEAAHDILSGLDAGADAFIIKGTPQEELLHRISRVLAGAVEVRPAARQDFSQKLTLTRDREDIFRLLYNALLKETRFDILVLLVNGSEEKKPLVVTSRMPLPAKLLAWLGEQMAETFSLIGNQKVTFDDLKVQSIVAVEGDPLTEPPAGMPQKYVKVPLQDTGELVGVLGVFSYAASERLDEKIRLFFDLGVEFSRALQRISLEPR